LEKKLEDLTRVWQVNEKNEAASDEPVKEQLKAAG
jgi:hypothetical protein